MKDAPRNSGPEASQPVRLERNPAGQLVVHLPDREAPVVDAGAARCFPWSMPDQYISLRDADGKELVLLRSMDELDPASRKVLDEELQGKVFNPVITRVVEFKHEFGVTNVTAETDRGTVTFQIRSRDDVRVLSDRRALLRDADGNSYELSDLDALDPASRKHLQQYF
ncbi:MAG TPA: DUF1854 domain-containing protein [Phycisphaerae bacterium]|nr:DUF1854 domain-containing protein [Phycisphaerae bacterium]